ncbi:hypothetical protein QGP82_00090 [Leptothoe sp. LEGE 181152]|nr:hypothetical protein [Leptothoe sp. LEGE 181152]
MTKKISLHVSYEINSLGTLGELNPHGLMNELLRKNYKHIEISGKPIAKIADIIPLAVECDAEFLVEGYLSLKDNLIKGTHSFEHFCYLNDGVLEIQAKIDNSNVTVTYSYCPKLDIINLVTHTEKITIEQYQYLWRGIVCDLLSVLKSI